jgi:hypothetical protein
MTALLERLVSKEKFYPAMIALEWQFYFELDCRMV